MECSVLNIDKIFEDFYQIPEYQRDFVWKSDNVRQILEDIDNSCKNSQDEEYFIGCSVVIGDSESNNHFSLVDGQQRLTTLFMILCAIKWRVEDTEFRHLVSAKISSQVVDAKGGMNQYARIRMSNPRNHNILEKISSNQSPIESEIITESERNLLDSYKAIKEFFSKKDESSLKQFYGYLVNKTTLVRIRTDNIDNALVIFETINERGIGLDSFDLLKNLLYMQLQEEQYEDLTKIWTVIRETIEEKNEKPMRFLRYFVLSRYDIENLIYEKKVYKWIKETSSNKFTHISDKPLEFARVLRDSAGHYVNLLHDGVDFHNEQNTTLQNLRLLGGSATRQHMMLLLAGKKLESEKFNLLLRNIESVLFFWLLTRARSQDLENMMFQWTRQLQRMGQTDEEFSNLIQKISSDSEPMQRQFFQTFSDLNVSSFVYKYRCQYFLAKINQYIQILSGRASGTECLNDYIDGHDIEHIAPDDPTEQAKCEFGECDDYRDQISRMGNIVLVEQQINKSASNLPFSEKRTKYKHSKNFLVRSMGDYSTDGLTQKECNTLDVLKMFDTWNPESIVARQDLLEKFAWKIWGMPVA